VLYENRRRLGEFGRFYVQRDGFRWVIRETGSDGIARDIHPVAGRFWRWITAARFAIEFNRVRCDGAWEERMRGPSKE
jgi:hypothetical protein